MVVLLPMGIFVVVAALFMGWLMPIAMGQYGYEKPQWVPFTRVVARGMAVVGGLMASAGLFGLLTGSN